MNKYYRSLVLADGQDGQPHVEVKRRIVWGQSPELAKHYHRPELGEVKGIAYDHGESLDNLLGSQAGALHVGDRVKFLTGAAPGTGYPRPGNPVRVFVQTHDGRTVGHSGNAVWIVWPGVKEARRIFRICSD